MSTKITTIGIDKLTAHPDNPNRMSRSDFAKLVRHIERTGRYEPLIVRPYSSMSLRAKRSNLNNQNEEIAASSQRNETPRNDKQHFQIINGHHRFEALKQLGFEKCDCVVWEVDDDEAALLLATLNRLGGSDLLDKKLALLKKLSAKHNVNELSKLLPNTKKQIARMIELQKTKLKPGLAEDNNESIAYPLVFFLNTEQKAIVESALSKAVPGETKLTKASRNAKAITKIAKVFLAAEKVSLRAKRSNLNNQNKEIATATLSPRNDK